MSWLNVIPSVVCVFALWRWARVHNRSQLLSRAWDLVIPGSESELGVLLGLLESKETMADRRSQARERDDSEALRDAEEMCALFDGDIETSCRRLRGLVPIPVRSSRSA